MTEHARRIHITEVQVNATHLYYANGDVLYIRCPCTRTMDYDHELNAFICNFCGLHSVEMWEAVKILRESRIGR